MIEQMINRSAKTTGGVVSFSLNRNAYYCWCVTRHKRASYLEAMYVQLRINTEATTVHGSLRPCELRNSEKDVQQLYACNPAGLHQRMWRPICCGTSVKAKTLQNNS